MLAAAGDALLQALRNHRHIRPLLKEIERLPQLELQELLLRYSNAAPAYYLLPGVLAVADDMGHITFTLAGVVRNVGNPDAAFAGDGIDIGCDQLLQLAIRAIHSQSLGGCSWSLVRAEMEDDPLFDEAGVSAIAMTFQSSAIELAADWEIGELASFKRFHADLDVAPAAGTAEHQKWLQEPPNHTTSRPDADLDVQLQGA